MNAVVLLFALFATAFGVEVNATGSCPCYYGGKLHHCNRSPFKGDTRCVCGPKKSDWKSREECKEPAPPTPAPPTPKGSCPCYYGGKIHNCNPSPFPGDTRCVCGPKKSDWKSREECKEPLSVEVNATGSCPCYYGGKIHHCNRSPFKGDTRCVCGPKKSDWKSREECQEPAPPTPAPPTPKGSCPCYYGGKIHHCNRSPFKGDTRCVCGPKGSDWKTQEECQDPLVELFATVGAEPPSVEVNAEGSCPCYYGGKIHHCNRSPFSGDTRCVCGPKASDWKSREECKEPGPLPTEMSCSNDFCNSLNNDNDMYNFGQLVVEDKSCQTKGGVGCNAQGKNQVCRFCTWKGDHKTPTCPQCACDRLNLKGCGSPQVDVAFNTTNAVLV